MKAIRSLVVLSLLLIGPAISCAHGQEAAGQPVDEKLYVTYCAAYKCQNAGPRTPYEIHCGIGASIDEAIYDADNKAREALGCQDIIRIELPEAQQIFCACPPGPEEPLAAKNSGCTCTTKFTVFLRCGDPFVFRTTGSSKCESYNKGVELIRQYQCQTNNGIRCYSYRTCCERQQPACAVCN